MRRVILALSFNIVFSLVKGILKIIKSIAVLTVGISCSSINCDKELTTKLLILGNSSSNISFFFSSFNASYSLYFIIFSYKYLIPLGLRDLFFNNNDQ